jgi:hypothetical protein
MAPLGLRCHIAKSQPLFRRSADAIELAAAQRVAQCGSISGERGAVPISDRIPEARPRRSGVPEWKSLERQHFSGERAWCADCAMRAPGWSQTATLTLIVAVTASG